MKIDPYNHKERYLAWRKGAENGIQGLSKENSDIILLYLDDMQKGINIGAGSSRGPRGFNRLNSLKNKLQFFARKFIERGINAITNINED